jgi:3-deoxy-D-manno-octulosonic-acid transferase
MRRLYTALLWLAIPLASLVVLWRGLTNRQYWLGWRGRFGGDSEFGAPHVWVHAVSLGEVQAAGILIRALQADNPQLRVLLTTATPTGRERARQQLGDSVAIRFAPYDLPLLVRRVLRSARVSLLIILETELWPNLLHECARAGIPALMVSARVSERTVRRLGAVRGVLSRTALANLSVAAQTSEDARRFERLGVAPAAIRVCGNIKFDLVPDDALRARGQLLRSLYAPDRPLWVAGSSHAGEELAVLDAQAALLANGIAARLVIAPRHPQRFAEVATLLTARGIAFTRRSQPSVAAGQGASDARPVLLLDTLGELHDFYAAADLAFVGGSLVPIGGHNLLEPAALGVATITGSQQFNAPDIARLLAERGALCVVPDSAALITEVVRLMRDERARAQLADAARATVAASRGALEQIMRAVRERIREPQQAPQA